MTLNDLLPDILGRLEENDETGGPIFWNLIYEILPALVDAMFEAELLTGVVQAVNVPVILPPNTTYFNIGFGQGFGYGEGGYGEGGYGGGAGVPGGAFACLRLKAPWPIRKVTLKGLDDVVPGWQSQGVNATGYGVGGYGEGSYGGVSSPDQLRAWFPLGISGFGIWPQLTVESQVLMDFLVAPTMAPRPYNTTLPVPFQEEFTSAFGEYAATMLRMKELGAETEETEEIFDAFMEQMRQLSLFQNRLDSLVLTQSYGANVGINRRTTV
jgi:hypothetical protein